MSTICKDIMQYIESFAPADFAEEWDNIGLLVGSVKHEVKRVLICLDVNNETVSDAIEQKADMIISHHPVIFKSLKRVSSDDEKGSIIYKLIKANTAVYSAHTNLDVSDEGINALLAEIFKLSAVENLKVHITSSIKVNESSYINKLPGLGKVGILQDSMCLKNLATLTKSYLNTPTVRVAGDINRQVKKVAVFCGSFDDDIDILISQRIDVLITGEIKYHTVLDAIEAGITIIEAGHFITENVIINKLCNMLSTRFPEVRFIDSKEKDPYSYI